MPGIWADVHPYLPYLIGAIIPTLTLLYSRRDAKSTTERVKGQQLTDNLYKEIDRLTKLLTQTEAQRDQAQKAAQSAEDKAREIQKIHDDKMAEWIQYGTTRAEQLEQAKFAYAQRMSHNAAHPKDDVRP